MKAPIAFHAAVVLAITAAMCVPALGKKKPPASAPTTSAVQDQDADYAQAIEKRAQDVITALGLADAVKAARVHDVMLAQYRALRDWHESNDTQLKELGAASSQAAGNERKDIEARIELMEGSLAPLHQRFLAALSADLSPSQVEVVKDKMTYNKVKVTYDAYLDIVPNLSVDERAAILHMLKDAREEAMDGGSVGEKSAIFKKYKGKINNYLNGRGHDVARAYQDWGARQKAKPATQPAQGPMRGPNRAETGRGFPLPPTTGWYCPLRSCHCAVRGEGRVIARATSRRIA